MNPPARRSRSMLYGVAFLALGLLFFLFAALDLLFVGSAFFVFARHRANVQMAILKSGLPAQAVITSIRDVSIATGSGNSFTEVEYRYESSPGQMHKGKSGLLTTEETRGWNVGERGTIKFDAASPAQSVWIGHRAGNEGLPPQSPPSLLTIAKRSPAFWIQCSLAVVVAIVGWLPFSLPEPQETQTLIICVGLFLAGALLLFLGLRKLMIWRRVLKNGVLKAP